MPTNEHTNRLRTPEAAAHLGLKASTLEKYRVVGGGHRYAKLGKIVTYARADLDAWATARLRTSTSETVRAA